MPLSPLYGIHQAVNFPSDEVRITIEDAIQAYTLNNAKALAMDHLLGSIAFGKYADFIVLNKSPFKVDKTEIKDLTVHSTFVGGRCIYTKQ
jgi:predicted amidohydrolase YtcJ